MELLEGVPTVVFGYFALLFVTPILQSLIPGLNLFNPISAGLVLGFAILPYISNVASDAMMAVPRSLREAAYALGATKFEVVTRVVFPAAISGIVAAILLATSRAVGETMIAAIAAGQRPLLTLDPRETSYIVQAATGDQPAGSLASRALFSVGATLFMFTLTFNILAQRVVERYRERYE
jgi:phosphate transport system permease protein